MLPIDHIVYTVPDLEKGMDYIENLFGIRPVYGGKHEHQGTHNALLNLGNEIYFELLAIDSGNTKIPFPRWMGVDLIDDQSMLSRWAVKSEEIDRISAILKSAIPLMGGTKTGMRKRADGSILNWELTLPLPGPMVEIIPFFIDWKNSEHPTANMPQHCQLLSFKAKHPKPEIINKILASLDVSLEVEKADKPSLIAEIETPNGIITLS